MGQSRQKLGRASAQPEHLLTETAMGYPLMRQDKWGFGMGGGVMWPFVAT